MIIEKQKMGRSLSEVHGSIETSGGQGWKKVLSFLGPAYLISVGYMDPGNWATDIQGGSQFGYSLIWVLLMSNLMALLLQGLSARLGIVQGRDLAQANRQSYPKLVNFTLYILAEIAIAACDLAEVLGMAIGIQLLTGLPLIWGVAITVLDTFLLLYLQRLGMRKMEAFIISLVGIIAIAFLIQIYLAKPSMREIATGFLPKIKSKEALYIAIGIIGATVMPHNLYLHSSLVQTRKFDRTPEGIHQAIKFNRIDSTIALNMAFLVNTAILVVAGTVFFKTGNSHVAEIHEAYLLLPHFLGKFAPILFAVALIAAGQSSTITGTLAGQIVMEGYLNLRINPLLRRLLTRSLAIIPAMLVIIFFGADQVDSLLVLSQVILSLQLGFAIIPLIHFVSDKETMGRFAINLPTRILAWLIAIILLWLNIQMLVGQSEGVFHSGVLWPKLVLGSIGAFFALLLGYLVVEPIARKRKVATSFKIHPEMETLSLDIPIYNTIAIALDFTENDGKLISYAIGQGHKGTRYVLLHIVESASAKLWGNQSADYETRKDHDQLDGYVDQLKRKGFQATSMLGFRNRSREIVRLVTESGADMLVVGAHGHSGIKDLIYGETVNSVRHELTIPILMVSIKDLQ